MATSLGSNVIEVTRVHCSQQSESDSDDDDEIRFKVASNKMIRINIPTPIIEF